MHFVSAVALVALVATPTQGGEASNKSGAEMSPPFSGPANVAYAKLIWSELEKAGFVGSNSMVSYPYFGNLPHGGVLELLEKPMTIDGHTGVMIVKKNLKSLLQMS